MRSPAGSEAMTRELSWERLTSGAGTEGEIGISEGFFERSTMLTGLLMEKYSGKGGGEGSKDLESAVDWRGKCANKLTVK